MTPDSASAPSDAAPLASGILATLDRDVRNRLAAAGRVQDLKTGTYLSTQGHPHEHLAVILRGTLTVSVHAHGDAVELARIGPGETVGEMNVLDPHQASADVVALEPVRAWMIGVADFHKFIDADPADGLAVVRVLAAEVCRRLRHNSETMLRQFEQNRANFRDMDY